MSENIFGQVFAAVDEKNVSTRKDPVFGDVTIFHDVVIVRENVQPYEIEGQMLNGYKSADQLEQYWPYVEGRWAIAGHHPQTPVIVSPNDIAGRTVNSRFVKNLIDHGYTERPNIRGILADLEVFNDRVAPAMLESMLDGSLPAVSIGFLYGKDFTPGMWNGRPYDFVQTNMFHDHLAFGIVKGRCDYPACGIGADELLAPKCLNQACSNREVTDMEPGIEPEETDELITIPNPGVDGCEESKTIALSDTEDIGFTVCGDEHAISAFTFSKASDWTMEKAQEWVEENKEGAADLLATRIVALDYAVEMEDLRAAKLVEARDAITENDMSEEDVLAKIAELTKKIEAIYEAAERVNPIDYAVLEPLQAERWAYKEALEEMIVARVANEVKGDEVEVDELERSKRLLRDPRLRRDGI